MRCCMSDFSRWENSFSPLADLAASLHEMFTSLVTAGFSESQALFLTSKMIIRQDGFDIITDEQDGV